MMLLLLPPSDCVSFSHYYRSLRTTTLFRRLGPTTLYNRSRKSKSVKASLVTNSDWFQVGRPIGSYGFMNVTSYSAFPSTSGSDTDSSFADYGVGGIKTQDVGEGSVKIRLYEGRVSQGPLRGTPVVFKVYPGKRAGGIEADMMAANELNAHSFLQSSSEGFDQHLVLLVGGFETITGEQWLAFRDDGKYSAADYAKVASERVSRDRASGELSSWNRYEKEQKIKRRQYFIIRLLHGAIRGLAYMHEHDRLHQSLGPYSVVLKYASTKHLVLFMIFYFNLFFHFILIVLPYPTINVLATWWQHHFRKRRSVFDSKTSGSGLFCGYQVSYSELEEDPRSLADGLWRRATAAGAFTRMEKRAFGIADDIYEAGLLLAYLAFVPFCEAGVMDGLSLQRLLENTFQLDIGAAREYCTADDRLADAVEFLDLGNGAGWELLQAMLNADFRKRPMAQAVLNHRFMSGAVL